MMLRGLPTDLTFNGEYADGPGECAGSGLQTFACIGLLLHQRSVLLGYVVQYLHGMADLVHALGFQPPPTPPLASAASAIQVGLI